MQLPLQIATRNANLDPGTERVIRSSVEKLATFYDRIMGCRVLVEVPQRHRVGAPISYNVRIDLTVPGGELVVRRKPRLDLLTAVQDAFEAAERRLQEYARRQRGDVKQRQTGRQRGVVRRLFPYEGYGFLEAEDGREIYFHQHSVLHGGFRRLTSGVPVWFVEEEGHKGPQASTVALARRRRAAGIGPRQVP